jgi:HK97 family phage major capsid protein
MSKATDLREQALAKFLEAKALTEGEDIKAENEPQFQAIMAEARDLDAKAAAAAGNENELGSLKERLEFYGSRVSGAPTPFTANRVDLTSPKSLGEAFTGSKEYRELLSGGALLSDQASFKSAPFLAAATDVIGTGGGGGSALVTPQYLPGIIPLPQRPLKIRQLFSQGTTSSDTISYAQQTSFTSGATAVSQATSVSTGLKPQSSASWTRKTAIVETIATWMAVTRQMLADAGQIRALIDNQIGLMLQLEEEEQLLNGNGISPNLEGIYAQAIQTLDVSGATSLGDPNLDAIRTAIRMIRTGLSRATADGVVLNPTDGAEFDLLTDGFGRYRVGDPYAYAVPGSQRQIWGLNRVDSEAVAIGHALVGAFTIGATVLERQGITILTADQHADFFVRNLVVVLAEERLGFPVFFPSAFVDVTLKDFSYLSA